jgi:hypothetical protein
MFYSKICGDGVFLSKGQGNFCTKGLIFQNSGLGDCGWRAYMGFRKKKLKEIIQIIMLLGFYFIPLDQILNVSQS